jgi:hypothetical protein
MVSRPSALPLRLASTVLLVACSAVVAACGGTATSDPDETNAGGSGGSHSEPTGGAGGSGGAVITGGSSGAGGGCTDSDGDGINDARDGYSSETDTDSDAVPDYLDLDSDGDGRSDADEAGPHAPCEEVRDTDGDGTPDFRDLDSDWDYLPDAREVANGWDPYSDDTDGDGCPDLESFYFAGHCDAAENLALFNDWCMGAVWKETTTVTVLSDIPASLNDLSIVLLRVDDPPGQGAVTAELVSVTPADAGVIEDGELQSVEPGAEIAVTFSFYPSSENETNLWVFELWSASQAIIANKRLLWVTTGCAKV